MGAKKRKPAAPPVERAETPAAPEARAGIRRYLPVAGLAVVLGAITWIAAPYLIPVKLPADYPRPPDLKNASTGLRDAVANADKEARRKPGSAEAMGHLGMVYHANQFFDQAATAYRIAARLAPDDYQWVYGRAFLDEENGDDQEELKLLRETVRMKKDYAPALLKLADSYFKLDQLDQASHYYELAAALPDSSASLPATFGLGRVAARRRDWKKVLEIVEPLSRSYSYLLPPFELLQETYEALGRKDKAAEARQNGAATKWKMVPPPDDPFNDRLTGVCYSATRLLKQAGVLGRYGRPDRALEIARRAQQADPNDPGIPNFIAYTLMTFFGEQPPAVDEALNQLATSLRLRPDDLLPLWSFADEFFKSPKPPAAVARFAAVLQPYAGRPEAHFYLAQIADQQGRLPDALAGYEAALEVHPESAVYNKLGQALLHAGRSDEAVANLRKAVQLNATNTSARLNLGIALMDRHDYGHALLELGELLRIKPQEAAAHFCAGYCYLYSKRPDEAVASFRAGLKYQPDDADAHYGLASAYFIERRREEALAEVRESLRLRPDNPAARELMQQLGQ